MTGERVLVAMSGGVDSSCAAALLRDAGYAPVGVHLSLGLEPGEGGSRSCCSAADAADARQVAERLGIPFYSIDAAAGFARIRDAFVAAYASGRTPVPCEACNRDLKFGRLAELAGALGIRRIATGHYARILQKGGRATLARGVDREKDQSYFLWSIGREGLDRALFPLGPLSKGEVRQRARELGLAVAEKPESQDLCFIPDGGYRRWLRRSQRLPDRPGDLVDRSGRVLGRHPGIHHFTVGQRHGLGIAAGSPRYVLALDPATNRVVVGPSEELASGGLHAEGACWLVPEPPGPIRVEAAVRYRSSPVPGVARALPGHRLEVRFDSPVRAVAPGQSVVLYDGEVVLGGAHIAAARPVAREPAVPSGPAGQRFISGAGTGG